MQAPVVVNLPDTVGYAIPFEYGNLIKTSSRKGKKHRQSHFERSLSQRSRLGSCKFDCGGENGARQVECTINGIGERAGNASLEEFVMALRTRPDILPFQCDVKTEEIFKSSRLLSTLTGMMVQRNKAIVGANAFSHEAGIHQDGIIKSRMTYEIMTPESVGIKHSTLVLGKHSGRHALKKRFEELGYSLTH